MDTFVRPAVIEGAHTLPAAWYVDPKVYEDERGRVFGQSWQCVGRAEQLASPGDYFVADIAGESLIVTRDADARPHAFYNVCRHRGTRICEAASGHFQGSIMCPYHAWTYGLDGALKAARNMGDVPGFDRANYPLKEAGIALWEGFVFVNLATDPDPFESVFAPIVGRFVKWNIGGLRTARTISYEIKCNWKLIFQNYSECYHCPLVHPQLDKLSPSDSGRNDLIEGPALGGYSEMRVHGTSLTTTGHSNRAPLGAVAGEELDRVYYYTIFPSMLLSLHPDYVMVHYVKPLAIDRTAVECAFLFDPNTMQTPHFDPCDAVQFWDTTNQQDWHVSELTQRGLRSRAYTPGPYSNAEGLLHAFDRHYLEVMGA
jgi:Rieske 2Fe-2S family protein